MAPYRIDLLTSDGDLQGSKHLECAHDDEAIDHAGALNHPHEMIVWQGERRVAHFPPAPPLPGGRAR
jgi:hypothetical protein